MPLRKTPLITGEFYHVFNRTQNKEPFFLKKRDCDRTIETIAFYRFSNPPTRLSYFLSFGVEKRAEIIDKLKTSERLVEIISYCLMPTHFHFLLRQAKDGGVSRFMANFQNSLTKFRNVKYKRDGHLFKGQFKAVRIEDEEQMLQVDRYIHLNPYTSLIIRTLDELLEYPYSSFGQHLQKGDGFCEDRYVLTHFKNIRDYKKFVFDRADYQRRLAEIKHLALE